MKYSKQAEELANFIEKHPNCNFEIDNDAWFITENDEENQIADYSDYEFKTNWYSYGNLYGAALSEAMVILLNRRGFNIKASAV